MKAEGSSYRQPGARLVVHPDGRGTMGLLSAGGLEEEIALQGGDVMERGTPRLMEYDTRKLFGCDGKLFIYPEKSRRRGDREFPDKHGGADGPPQAVQGGGDQLATTQQRNRSFIVNSTPTSCVKRWAGPWAIPSGSKSPFRTASWNAAPESGIT